MDTSWQKVSGWYKNLVKEKGHYFHEHLVIPKSLALLSLDSASSLLDLGCGEGVLARSIPKNIYYQGVDIAASLIAYAKQNDRNPLHKYAVGNVTKSLPIAKKDFTHAVFILALQNISEPFLALKNAAAYLKKGGKLLIVLNHPYFRIPRQTSWGIDEKNKIQYRRIDRYLTPLKIPINMHPGETKSPVTWSFHFPLSNYSKFLHDSGFVIAKIEEWTSDKISVGNAAKMENRSREEFPLFMAILAEKR